MMPRVFRHLTFSLRSLLVGVSFVCGLLGWTTWQWQAVKARQALLPRMNGTVGNFSVRVIGIPGSVQPEIPWLRRILGDFGESNLIYFQSADPQGEELRQVRELFPEATIWGCPGERSLPTGVQPMPEEQYYII